MPLVYPTMTDTTFIIKVPIVLLFAVAATCSNYTDIDLPSDHIKYYFNYFPTVAEECRNNTFCPYKVITRCINNTSTQGYVTVIKGSISSFSIFPFAWRCMRVVDTLGSFHVQARRTIESFEAREADTNEGFFLEKLRIALIPKLVGVTSRIAKPKILFPFLNVQVITKDG